MHTYYDLDTAVLRAEQVRVLGRAAADAAAAHAVLEATFDALCDGTGSPVEHVARARDAVAALLARLQRYVPPGSGADPDDDRYEWEWSDDDADDEDGKDAGDNGAREGADAAEREGKGKGGQKAAADVQMSHGGSGPEAGSDGRQDSADVAGDADDADGSRFRIDSDEEWDGYCSSDSDESDSDGDGEDDNCKGDGCDGDGGEGENANEGKGENKQGVAQRTLDEKEHEKVGKDNGDDGAARSGDAKGSGSDRPKNPAQVAHEGTDLKAAWKAECENLIRLLERQHLANAASKASKALSTSK